MKTIVKICVIAVLPCAGHLVLGQGLEVATPESQGVPSRAILRWIAACENYSTNGLKGHLHGFVILRHGRTIAEGTWAPQNTLEKPHMLYSHSKSFTSTAIEGRRGLSPDEMEVLVWNDVIMQDSVKGVEGRWLKRQRRILSFCL